MALLSIFVWGCGSGGDASKDAPKPETPTTASATPSNGTEEKDAAGATEADSASVPAELKHAAFEYYGLDRKETLTVKSTGRPVGDGEGTQAVEFVEMKDGNAVYLITQTGILADLPSQEIVVRKDGVYTTKIAGNALKEPSLELPADLSIGKSWTSKGEFTLSESVTVKQDVNYKVVKIEKVKVPLGEYEALVLNASGSLTAQGQTNKISLKMWLAKGVGLIKSETETTQGGKPVKVVMEAIKGSS